MLIQSANAHLTHRSQSTVQLVRAEICVTTRVLCTVIAFLISYSTGFTANAQVAQTNEFQPATRQIKVISTNLTGFGVPFKVDENNMQFIEVHLYVSKDDGQTWQFHDRKPTSEREFPFRADGDGEYCFALRTLDVNRRLLPEGDIRYPELKIVVDTSSPELEFRIDTDPAGRVGCRWKAVDKHLNPKSLKIQYRAQSSNGASKWMSVPVELNGSVRNGIYADQISWWPDTTATTLDVQIQIADFAGNVATVDRKATVAKTAWRHRSRSSTLDAAVNQRPSESTGASDYANKSGSEKPPNVVCENGVCRIVENSAENLTGNPNWQRAIVPMKAAGHLPPSPTQQANTTSTRLKKVANSQGTGSQWTINRESSARRAIGANEFSRPSAVLPNHQADTNQFDTSQSSGQFPTQRIPLVGSQVEFASPPRPENWTKDDQAYITNLDNPRTIVGQNQNNSDLPNSIGWESETHQDSASLVQSSGSTLRPSPSILPAQHELPPRPIDNQPSNPGTMKKVGDLVVGQSTTTWPKNQWTGPEPSKIMPLPPQLAPHASNAQMMNSRDSAIHQQPAAPMQDYANTGYTSIARNDIRNHSQGNVPVRQSAYRPQENATSVMTRETATNRDPNAANQAADLIGQANTQIISSKRFQLNYDINAIDPSGVGQVDLWVTRDRGKTWQVWGQDTDNTSPFPAEVQEEGLYGFRIVVRSRDGLTGRGPMSGDAPDMWILVDVQSPMTKITSVPYGRGSEAGKLIINYRAADPHLSLRPIRLYWSPSPTSDWTAIEEGLRNEERFVWKVPRNVPDRIFLRIEAHDKAGNVGVHNLSQAIDVSGLVPRGTIFGVVPVGK